MQDRLQKLRRMVKEIHRSGTTDPIIIDGFTALKALCDMQDGRQASFKACSEAYKEVTDEAKAKT